MSDIDREARREFAGYLRTLARDAENAAWDDESPMRGEWKDKPHRVVSLLADKMRQAGDEIYNAIHEGEACVSALRLSRDLARSQLVATIAERDAERRLSDALAEALRDALRSPFGPADALASWAQGNAERDYVAQLFAGLRAALSAYDAARGAK